MISSKDDLTVTIEITDRVLADAATMEADFLINKADKLNGKGETNKDAITDFSVRDDAIWLDNAFFSTLGLGTESKPGQLKSSYFVKGSKAKDKNDFIIYDKAKGKLFYDADGSGSKIKAVEIATLSKDLSLTYKDFFVI